MLRRFFAHSRGLELLLRAVPPEVSSAFNNLKPLEQRRFLQLESAIATSEAAFRVNPLLPSPCVYAYGLIDFLQVMGLQVGHINAVASALPSTT
jgi:hypothetical protein